MIRAIASFVGLAIWLTILIKFGWLAFGLTFAFGCMVDVIWRYK